LSKRLIALLLATLWLAAPLVSPAAATETDNDLPGSYELAARKGPILWYVDEEKRRMMDEDLELLRLYTEAAAGKKRRKALSVGLFVPGALLFGGGLAAGIFRHPLGLYDDSYGDYLMATGMIVGVALIAPAVYFNGFDSLPEKRYEKYMRDKYGVTPILHFTPTKDGAYAQVGLRF
jgi:hypothetical protein